jgi:hypothetical protein
MSLFKDTSIKESVKLQFRSEFFNLANTPTFFLPSATGALLSVGNAAFGKLSSGTATGRQIQFGMKLIF